MRHIRRHTIHSFHFARTIAAVFLVSVLFITPSISSAAVGATPASHLSANITDGINSVANDLSSAWSWLFPPTPSAAVQFTPRLFPASPSPTPVPSPAIVPPGPPAQPAQPTSPPPTVINRQVTVTQNISSDQLNQIEQQVGSSAQLQISSLQQSLANLTSQLTILQSNTGRVFQAPVSTDFTSQYPNAVSFSEANFTGPLTGTTATFSGALTANSTFTVANLVNFNNSIFGTFLGHQAGNVTTGSWNTFVGYSAGLSNTTGFVNTALGHETLTSNTTGSYNTAVGNHSQKLMITGSYNTSMGEDSLSHMTQGNQNTAIGVDAMNGVNVSNGGSNNTAVGVSTLFLNTSGTANTALGSTALYNNTTANQGVAVGSAALYDNTTGARNVAVGYNAGYNPDVTLATNSNSVFVGPNANSSADGLDNVIALGSASQATKSNQVVLGNTSIVETLLRGNVGIGQTNPSDRLSVTGDNPYLHLSDSDSTIRNAGITLDTDSGPWNIMSGCSSGTTGNLNFAFNGKTVAETKVSVTSGGNFGIGTTNVDAAFELTSAATTTNLASISGTSLTTGAAFSIRVPASTSFSGPIFVATDTNGVVLASLSSGGRFSIRRTMFSHGADTTNCTGVGTPSAGCIDYAESMPTADSSIAAGDIVAVSGVGLNVIKSQGRGDSAVLGIVSTNPAALITGNDVKLGDEANHFHQDGFVPVALAGRVPVKTSLENGSIEPGDKLTASSVPGVAMKATEPGEIVGTALEPLDSIASGSYQKLMTFVNVGYWAPSVDSVLASASLDPTLALQTTTGSRFTLSTLFNFILDQFRQIGFIFSSDGSFHAKQLCAGNTCVDEAQLQQLLQNAGPPSATSTPTPTPSPSATPTPTPTPSDTPTPEPSPSPTPTP